MAARNASRSSAGLSKDSMVLVSSAATTKRSPRLSSSVASLGLGLLSPPHASDYLPGVSPGVSPGVVYSTAQASWSPQELQTLHAGLAQFPADRYDNVTRYIKIAASLPRKCVRDVAFKVKALGYPRGSGKSSSMGQASSATPRLVTKRMKIEPYQDPCRLTMPQPTTDELEETQLTTLLQDNVLAINTMRTNLLNGKADENRAQMLKFRDNCQAVLSTLGGICTSIPPLPLKLDTSLLSDDPPSTDDNNGSNGSNNTVSTSFDLAYLAMARWGELGVIRAQTPLGVEFLHESDERCALAEVLLDEIRAARVVHSTPTGKHFERGQRCDSSSVVSQGHAGEDGRPVGRALSKRGRLAIAVRSAITCRALSSQFWLGPPRSLDHAARFRGVYPFR